MGRCDGLEFIWETVPQTTSFKYDRSLPQGTMCLFKMKVLSSLLSTILRRAFSVPRYPYLSGTMKVYFGSRWPTGRVLCGVEISAVRSDASGLSVWPRYSTNYRLSDWPCVVSGDTVLPDTAAVAERYSIAGVWILFDRCRNASVLKYFVVTVARLSTSRNTSSRRQTSTRTRTDARTLTASTHNALGLIYWLRKTKKYLKHAPKCQ